MIKQEIKNKERWNSEIKKNVMLYPDERVVAFIANNYKNKDNSNKNAIDIGFGSGRNLIPLLDYGFNCYGIDYNEECCKVARSIFKDKNNLKVLYNQELEKINFNKDFFDVVIIYGVIFYSDYRDMEKYLKKIHGIMKKGGKLLVNFRTNEDDLKLRGKKINEYSYEITKQGKEYEGLFISFLNLNQAKTLLNSCGFKVINYEKNELWKNNLQDRHSWFIFTAECV